MLGLLALLTMGLEGGIPRPLPPTLQLALRAGMRSSFSSASPALVGLRLGCMGTGEGPPVGRGRGVLWGTPGPQPPPWVWERVPTLLCAPWTWDLMSTPLCTPRAWSPPSPAPQGHRTGCPPHFVTHGRAAHSLLRPTDMGQGVPPTLRPMGVQPTPLCAPTGTEPGVHPSLHPTGTEPTPPAGCPTSPTDSGHSAHPRDSPGDRGTLTEVAVPPLPVVGGGTALALAVRGRLAGAVGRLAGCPHPGQGEAAARTRLACLHLR